MVNRKITTTQLTAASASWKSCISWGIAGLKLLLFRLTVPVPNITDSMTQRWARTGAETERESDFDISAMVIPHLFQRILSGYIGRFFGNLRCNGLCPKIIFGDSRHGKCSFNSLWLKLLKFLKTLSAFNFKIRLA